MTRSIENADNVGDGVQYDEFASHGTPLAASDTFGTTPRNVHIETSKTAANVGSTVRFDAIQHRFGATTVIHHLDLSIEPGELVALLGPSGCGKSTLLRILAGLQVQTSGHVAIGGECVDGLSPSDRGVGIVFQNYALFPHMSVLANVAYGLEAKGVRRAEAALQANAMLEMVRMSAFGERFPKELSGGQQQRIALARTLAVKPRILLLDEPFAALDKSLRLDMQIEIRRLQRDLNITTIMVTHDQEEAMSMADRVAVLNNGRLEQFAPAAEIYDRPASPFVASFVGTANMLPGKIAFSQHQTDTQACVAMVGPAQSRLLLAVPDYADGTTSDRQLRAGGDASANADNSADATDARAEVKTDVDVVLAVRPEQWDWTPAPSLPHGSSDPSGDGLPVVVQLVLPLGPSLIVDTLLDNTVAIKLILSRGQSVLPQTGQRITLRIKPQTAVRVFKA